MYKRAQIIDELLGGFSKLVKTPKLRSNARAKLTSTPLAHFQLQTLPGPTTVSASNSIRLDFLHCI